VLYRLDLTQSILFTEEGVHSNDDEIEAAMDTLERNHVKVWILANRVAPRSSDQSTSRAFARMIETTSPELRQYKKWAKEHMATVYCFDMWNWEEIYMLK
jgi:hypothetical protein